MNINDISPANYDKKYLAWKGWDKEGFALLSNVQSSYFSCELKRGGVSIPKKSKVLEVGFGNGSFLQFCSKNDFVPYGTELNTDLIDLANSMGYEAMFTKDLTAYPNNFFGLVAAFDVLEHIAQEEILDFLSEVKRILKPGGFFIARFPNGDSPIGLATQHGDITHLTTLGSGKVRYFCRSLNVKVLLLAGEAKPIFVKSFPHFSQRLLSVPFKILLNSIINLIFYPRSHIDFCAANLVLIFEKTE